MSIEIIDEQSLLPDGTPLRDLAALVLSEEGLPAESEVDITFVDDEAIADLNTRHMGRSGPTDVLAFPLLSLTPGVVPAREPAGPPIMLGDVIVAPAYVARQAAVLGVPVEAEMALMVVHGLLHLLGYDHAEEADAELMEGRERRLLGMLGWERR